MNWATNLSNTHLIEDFETFSKIVRDDEDRSYGREGDTMNLFQLKEELVDRLNIIDIDLGNQLKDFYNNFEEYIEKESKSKLRSIIKKLKITLK